MDEEGGKKVSAGLREGQRRTGSSSELSLNSTGARDLAWLSPSCLVPGLSGRPNVRRKTKFWGWEGRMVREQSHKSQEGLEEM